MLCVHIDIGGKTFNCDACGNVLQKDGVLKTAFWH